MSAPIHAQPVPLMPTYGKQDLPETAAILTSTRIRKWRDARERFAHRTPNRLNDPFTYFHIVRWLLQIQTWKHFTARSLALQLNQFETSTQWDAITVGKILNDIAESAELANPGDDMKPLWMQRSSTGMRYQTSHSPAARKVLVDLLDDLVELGNRLIDDETRGLPQPRTESLLARCPSMGQILQAEAA